MILEIQNLVLKKTPLGVFPLVLNLTDVNGCTMLPTNETYRQSVKYKVSTSFVGWKFDQIQLDLYCQTVKNNLIVHRYVGKIYKYYMNLTYGL